MVKWLVWFVLPVLLGIAAGYGLQQYECHRFIDEFLPYQTVDGDAIDPRNRLVPELFVGQEHERNYGEINSYHAYTAEWKIVNTGKATLTLDVESATCDVLFGGKAEQHAIVDPKRYLFVTLRWSENGSRREYHHVVKLKTNDAVEQNRELEFAVTGTVEPLILIRPLELDFGKIPANEPQQLSSRVYCFDTKKFDIAKTRFSDPALEKACEVAIEPVADSPPIDGKPVASCWQITVKARHSDSSQPLSGTLFLQSNEPDVTDMQISIRSQ